MCTVLSLLSNIESDILKDNLHQCPRLGPTIITCRKNCFLGTYIYLLGLTVSSWEIVVWVRSPVNFGWRDNQPSNLSNTGSRALSFEPPVSTAQVYKVSHKWVSTLRALMGKQTDLRTPAGLTDKMQPPWNLARSTPLPTTWRRHEKIANRTNWGNISLPSLQPMLQLRNVPGVSLEEERGGGRDSLRTVRPAWVRPSETVSQNSEWFLNMEPHISTLPWAPQIV